MPKVKLSSKGQLSIPKEIREQLNLKQGDYLLLEQKSGSITIQPLKQTILDMGGILHTKDMRTRSDSEIEEGVAEAAAERYNRSRKSDQ